VSEKPTYGTPNTGCFVPSLAHIATEAAKIRAANVAYMKSDPDIEAERPQWNCRPDDYPIPLDKFCRRR